MAIQELQSQPATACTPPEPSPWDTILHLVLTHLDDPAASAALRLVCKDWRTAADAAWRAGCFNCLLLQHDPPSPAPTCFASGAFLLGHLQELCLVEIQGTAQLWELAGELAPSRLPALRSLQLSASLAAPASRRLPLPAGALASLAGQLQSLQLDDITLGDGHLSSLTYLQQLVTLRLTASAAGWRGTDASLAGVSALGSLQLLQDLELPALGEADRDALAALTGLTRLAFMAAGSRAVGPSLVPLHRLRCLRIALAHTHEHFLVLHPLVDWDALARLTSLHSLAIDHLAANVLFTAPEVTWSNEVPAAQRADQLLGALPHLGELQLRLSYCRLLDDHTTDGQAERVTLCAPGARPRSFLRTVERVPARAPGQRRADAWHEAWWQPALLAHAAAASEAPSRAGMDAEAARRYLAEVGEVGGWASIRPGNYRSFDTLVRYFVADAQGCQQAIES